MNGWERDGTGDSRKIKPEEGIQLVVDLPHPTESRSHYQIIGNGVGVGQEEPCA